MARIVKTKKLDNTRLATNYGGWMYCEGCNENIGYLCYSTYDRVDLKYRCNCGREGSGLIDFADSKEGKDCDDELVMIKNRFCCPKTSEPLITILDKKVVDYDLRITCKECGRVYHQTKKIN